MLPNVRIARISTVAFFVVSQLKRQIESLSESGAHVTVVASSGPEMASLERIPDVDCVAIDIPRSISPWRDLRALICLYRFFRREHIDIAHSTTPKAGLLTAIAALLAGVPIRLHTFTGQPWVRMRGIKRGLARGSDKLIGKLSTRCYADSESQRQFLIEQGLIAPEQLFVIGAGSLAGVDTGRFSPARFSSEEKIATRRALNIPEDAQVILFVGRITVDKGVHELLEAFRETKNELNRVHLVFVGPFDSDSGVTGGISRRDIEGIQDTHVVSYTACPEAYMSIADILCLPSYREGFGTVVIEAAAMGVPTVGSNIYGLSDAVVDNETGILVPPRDSSALARALSMLLTDGERRVQMGCAARNRIEMLFDANMVNGGLIEEYHRLLLRAEKARKPRQL
ncbi:MAG: glycosyltransferase [Nitrosomonadales bacterium]|nr:glycosyltransferase [Nitrosomonadales bacterium]